MPKARPRIRSLDSIAAESVPAVLDEVRPAARSGDDLEVGLTVMVPASLKRAIRERAARDDVSIRAVVLSGLAAAGFDVADEIDVRRRRRA